MEERLQKILSSAGICSRRKAEEYLLAGRVTVNGRTAALGEKADPEQDLIEVDGVAVCQTAAYTYIVLHKPRGFVTTLSDEKGRPTVAQLVADCPARVWPVGRLDMDSEGLLILTNDGELTNYLTHPSHGIQKEYHVLVEGDIGAAIPLLSVPMIIDGEEMEADLVELIGPNLLKMIIHQGKNRQIRRMCAAAGLRVVRLIRRCEGGVSLGGLKLGTWRTLTESEVRTLSR